MRACVSVYARGADEQLIGRRALSPAQAPQRCHHKPVLEHLSHAIDGRQPSGNTCVYLRSEHCSLSTPDKCGS